jgi:hypothetical protein
MSAIGYPVFRKTGQIFANARLDLNGYSLRAYECETARDGKQFRLVSIPGVAPQKEAAVIRYIVNEGLIENILQGMSKEIEEEAGWAFFE